MYHNYCWVPRPMRLTDKETGQTELDDRGSKKAWKKRLPAAIEAGLTTSVWEIGDLLALIDAFVAERRKVERTEKQEAKAAEKAALAKAKRDELGPERAPFWVYRSHIHHTTKVHSTACKNCNDGHGKQRKGNNKSGEWIPFASYDDAIEGARALRPNEDSICNMCLGSYRTLGYRDSGSSRTALQISGT
jgi:hypothetical protein